MALSAGSMLGPYKILAPLGAGGMGEVYRARDTRLDREVALKVLPAEVSTDPERLRRFAKEARAASSLSHPNIVTIHDVGSEGGVSYIAMERVEGSNLRELLIGGPLPLKRLFQIAPQIAEGLAKAHEAGIVHRDLKPENLMVTRDGHVKILDFGLAKLTSRGSDSGEGSSLPTKTGTRPGMVLGTVGYMSPEQASGDEVGFRSDQFSFGSILYEMATGKRAFQGKTDVDTLSAILNQEPEPMAGVNPQAPAPLRWIVERCHAKEPNDRYGTTRDLARDLGAIRDHLSEAAGISGPSVARGRRRRRTSLSAVSAVVAVALLVAGALVGRRWTATVVPSFKRLTFQRGNVAMARFTGDGQTIVYGSELERSAVAGVLGAAGRAGNDAPAPARRVPPGDLSIGRAGDHARHEHAALGHGDRRHARPGSALRRSPPGGPRRRPAGGLGPGWLEPPRRSRRGREDPARVSDRSRDLRDAGRDSRSEGFTPGRSGGVSRQSGPR